MSSIFEQLTSQLGGHTDQIAETLGADPGATAKAIQAAIPLLVTGMAKNVQKPGGADALHSALAQHDGSILDSALNVFSELQANQGGGIGGSILGHILGGNRGAAEQGLAQASGLDLSQIARLLPLLAPLVLAALGKAKQTQGLDSGGLTDLLGREHEHAQTQQPGLMGMLGGLLDKNHDGSMMDEAMQMGTGLLGSLFGGQK
ncbi:MAG TPA: DUF937 domain-containing protein [Thermoanaerobaculia bacterium]|jgi:hypothetical protein|nr:DUF937 domain-containing protein [Thermoanaerobaculia bacterium]